MRASRRTLVSADPSQIDVIDILDEAQTTHVLTGTPDPSSLEVGWCGDYGLLETPTDYILTDNTVEIAAGVPLRVSDWFVYRYRGV